MSNHFLLAKVKGHSMWPTLKPGDILIIKKQKNYLPGDIITFKSGKTTITHRLIETDTQLLTKGDNMLSFDYPIRLNNILGAVVAIIRKGNRIIQFSEERKSKHLLISRYQTSVINDFHFLFRYPLIRRIGKIILAAFYR
jgi:signal peptidase I